MRAEQVEDTLTRRFHIERAPSLTARFGEKASIAFSRLRNLEALPGRSLTVPHEEAFSFHVPLSGHFFNDLWVSGRFKTIPQVSIGDVFLFDLSANPIVSLATPFDSLRFYVPQVALDEMAYDRGLPRIDGLHSQNLGQRDFILHGLAQTLAAAMERSEEVSSLFTDYMALAFHDHIARTYGNTPQNSRRPRGGLAPWQIRRALEFIETNLDGDPSIGQLANECGLSSGYFARAFKQVIGIPPHRWLMRRRVERAKQLLQATELPLADIAVASGFVDQSHLTRIFSRSEKKAPAAWRRLRRS